MKELLSDIIKNKSSQQTLINSSVLEPFMMSALTVRLLARSSIELIVVEKDGIERYDV